MEIVQGIWAAVAGAAALAPLATFGVVLVAYLAYRQKDRADRRDQWWKRAQWAIDLALDQDNLRQATGFAAIAHLASRSEATRGDRQLLWEVVAAQQGLDAEVDAAEADAGGIDTRAIDVHDEGAEERDDPQ